MLSAYAGQLGSMVLGVIIRSELPQAAQLTAVIITAIVFLLVSLILGATDERSYSNMGPHFFCGSCVYYHRFCRDVARTPLDAE